MSYTHLHAQPFVGEAIQDLFDVLVRYERATGRDYVVMVLPKYKEGTVICWMGGLTTLPGAIRTACQLLPKFERGNRIGLHHDQEVAAAIHYLLQLLAAHERLFGKTEIFLLMPLAQGENPVCFLGRVHISPREMLKEIERIARLHGQTIAPVS